MVLLCLNGFIQAVFQNLKTHPIHGSNRKVKAGWPLIPVESSSSTDLACLLANGKL